jgi:hypothetical protein
MIMSRALRVAADADSAIPIFAPLACQFSCLLKKIRMIANARREFSGI